MSDKPDKPDKMSMDDLLDKVNWISRLLGFIFYLRSWLPTHQSHKGHKGPWRIRPGVAQITVDRMSNTGGEAERALAEAHIQIGGRRITSKEAIFSVFSRQAAWAELVLLRAGVRLGPNHKMIDEANTRYAAGKGAVPLWGKAPAQAHAGPLPQARRPQQRKPKPKTSRQVIGRARRAWWKITETFDV